MLTSIFDPWP